MKEIFVEYLKRQQVIIYGCGSYGMIVKKFCSLNNINVFAFCDSDMKKWGGVIDEINCISPQELKKCKKAVVIVAIKKYEDVVNSLKSYTLHRLIIWEQIKEVWYDSREFIDQHLEDALLSDVNRLEEIKKNLRYKDKHKGERCFIIGNGPSVSNEDLSLLKGEYIFTVNQFARTKQYDVVESNYHIWSDPKFFKLDFECLGDYELLDLMKKLPEKTECFLPYLPARQYVEKYELTDCLNVNYYLVSRLVSEQDEIDFTKHIRMGYTVVQYAIRLAIYMGFKEIYLLGCECTTILNVINSKLSDYSTMTHCYEIGENEKVRAKNMYDMRKIQENYRDEAELLDEYSLLLQYCVGNAIKLVNCTRGGLLEELPRESLQDVLANNEGKGRC